MNNKSEIFCFKRRLGTCSACNVLVIAMANARWKSLNLETARREIGQEYCPDGELPQIELAINRDACYSLGQRKPENTDWS